MKDVLRGCAIVAILGTQIGGCASTGGGQYASDSAIGGCIAGALAGLMAKDGKVGGALAGCALGGLTGWAVGSYVDRQVATRAEAAKAARYDSRQTMLEVVSSEISPSRAVSRGATIETAVRYHVLAPDVSSSVKVIETRTLKSSNDAVQLSQREQVRAQGTHISTQKVSLPKTLPQGDYKLITTVSDGTTSTQVATPFTVI